MEISKLKIPWIENGKASTVAVYKKTKKSKTYYMVITDHHVDVVNNARATKPIIDHKYTIVELGIGLRLAESWAKIFKIKKPIIISKYK
jgi:hypothetical protein